MQNEPSSSPTLSTIFRESVSVEAFDERDLEFIWSCLLPSAQADALRWQVVESRLRSGPADLFRPGRVCPISDSIRIPATAFSLTIVAPRRFVSRREPDLPVLR